MKVMYNLITSTVRCLHRFILSVFAVGDVINVSGFTEADNNGQFKVATSSANKITVTNNDGDPVVLVDESAGDSVTIEEEPSLPGGVFTWSGEFDVPCRFDTDTLSIVYEDYESQATTAPIIEVLE